MGLVMAVEADKISTFREQLHSLIDEPWIPIKGALDLIKQVLYLLSLFSYLLMLDLNYV